VVGGEGALDELARIREQTDGEIGVGGATLATQLLRHGILDELLLYYHPVILGSGRPLFDTLADRVRCDLLEQGRFDNCVLVCRYAVRPRPGRSRPAPEERANFRDLGQRAPGGRAPTGLVKPAS
jgi:dihydrofolate reductase